MSEYRVTVIRRQVWHFTVKAENAEEAKDKADILAFHEPPHDDYADETIAKKLP